MEKLLKKKRKAEADNDKTLLTSVCTDLAQQYMNNGNYQLAIIEYNTLAMIFKQANKMLDYACANRMIGEAYTHLQMYDKALQHEEIYLKEALKAANSMEQQRAYATIGHIYLTMSLCAEEPNPNHLTQASRHFVKSLAVCEKLVGISKNEQMDMMARLFANLGVVKEAQGNFVKGIELVTKSVNICKTYDIYEQLERCYTTLGSLYCKSGEFSTAISNLNLAIEIAGRLPDKISLICASLITKADILMKMSDFQGAKRVLHKAYKMKTPIKTDCESIEKNLRIASAMCNTQESLLIVSSEDYKRQKTLYETLGDGACHFRCFNIAVNYYKKMLDCAINTGESGKALSPCYVSLAQTYVDNKKYDEAIEYYKLDMATSKDNLKETINTTFNIIRAMELADRKIEEILGMFESAEKQCVAADSNLQLARVIEREILYLKQHFRTTKAESLELKLKELDCPPSDSDSEHEEEDTTLGLGDDIDIDNITDLSSSDDEKHSATRSMRKRTSRLAIKRNEKGETQLHTASINGNLQLATKLLEQGHVVNIRDHAGWLPLHEACSWGHLEIVKLFIEHGASINDRGGKMCTGTTPLHDAASNGHLEILEYLLSKGASPLAKTDNGETVLYFLKSWRDRERHVFTDSAEEELYNRLVVTMMSALEKTGQEDTTAPLNASNEALICEDTDTSSCSASTSISRSNSLSSSMSSQRPKRANAANPVNRSNNRYKQSISRSSSTDLRRNRFAGDDDSILITQQSTAASDYRSTIDCLRNSSSVNDSLVQNSFQNKRKSAPNISAHLALDDVGDDWLVNDSISPENKRRRFNNSSVTQVGLINISDDSDFDDASGGNTENLAPKNTTIANKSQTNKVTKSQTPRTQTLQTTDNKRRRKAQSTLLKSGFTRVREDTPSPTQDFTSFRHNIDIEAKIQPKISGFIYNIPDDAVVAATTNREETQKINESDLNSTQALFKNQMLFIDVRIDGKLFRIPFPVKDLEWLTISWVADEAAKRYYKKESMKPVIEMETKNGAMLCGDDLLSVLFPLGNTQCEELQAKVVKWNVPPLRERYIDACNHFNVVQDEEIIQILETTSVTLNLSDRNYRDKVFPICRALNRQSGLDELNLSGNSATNKMLEPLCESLPTLTNLTTLNLSLNHLNVDALNTLASSLSSTGTILQSLTSLDLSYNPLGNESIKHLAQITQKVNLQKLHLKSTHLTSGLFNTTYNRQVTMALNKVQDFDISYNELEANDIAKFLDFMDSQAIERLNVGNNSIAKSGLGQCLLKFLKSDEQISLNLKQINLARCMLDDSDVFDLQRALTGANQLEQIDLSFNSFTGSSLKRLLINTTPKRLIIVGCDRLKVDCEAYNTPEWRFEDNRCTYLCSTLDCVEDYKQCDILIGMFRNAFPDCLDIEGLDEGMLKLSMRR